VGKASPLGTWGGPTTSLQLKAGDPLASIKNPNSNAHIKCSHYISIPCPIALIHKFSLIHKIDLALSPFFVSLCAKLVVVSAQ
jgi:hypothetical protein